MSFNDKFNDKLFHIKEINEDKSRTKLLGKNIESRLNFEKSWLPE